MIDSILVHFDTSSSERGARHTLSSCTLVCHTWNALARPYLFRRVSYTLIDDNEVPGTTDLRAILNDLRAFFEHHPELAIHVQQLGLKTIPANHQFDWNIRPSAGYHQQLTLMALLSLFPRLDRLDLLDVFIISGPTAELNSQRLSLKTLTIASRQVEIPSSDVNLLLLCFKEVCNLEVAVVCFFTYRRPEAVCPAFQHLAVHNLSTRDSMSGTLFTSLALSPSAHVLHSLSLQGLETSFLPGLQELLAATQSNLIHLSLSFNGFWQDERGKS